MSYVNYMRIFMNYLKWICHNESFETSKYKNKRLKNNFKTINISINDMDKFEKKRTNKEENIYKKYLKLLVWLVN